MRIILLAVLCFGMQQAASARNDREESHPDSVYVFTYTSGASTEGIKMAYSVDRRTWIPIGPNHSFVKSDFGSWGSNKRMFTPSVLYDGGKWFAVWNVNDEVQQFATTESANFWVWKPQDYPYLDNHENFLRPCLLKQAGKYIVRYQTKSGNNYEISSLDFRQWSSPQRISSEEYNHTNRHTDVMVSGNKQSGEIHRVPYPLVKDLVSKVSDASRRNTLYNENCGEDGGRFRGVKSLKASLSLTGESKPISTDLIGIFFEDINYSADGGLYAELIQNRDFEYNNLDHGEWNAKSFWEFKGEGASWEISTDSPIHANNSHYAVLKSEKGASLSNNGFDGIVVKKGDTYDMSLFAKSMNGKRQTITVMLKDGDKTLASTTIKVSSESWKQFNSILTPTADADKASLTISLNGEGNIGLDFISLFPQKTFKNRQNGLRADLAQILADIKPRFIRFPGGCVSHGNGLENMYRWIETVGPIWERKSQSNIWGYHQSKGLGFYEYFQFCEDIGAEPLPVLPAGVCCQNSSRGGHGQQGGLPMSEMDDYAQELMNLIDWANGDPKTSKYAKLRAEAGHPAPFNLKYLGVGNEDLISDVFVERFNYLNKKIKAKYPNIQVVGTVGPFFEGSDYEYGWELARDEKIDIVDEHYYVNPGWYIHSQNYYDIYDREGTKVYLGEWASRGNRLENALAEALHVTNLERNGDVVVMSSYAPLLAKHGHTQWNPDLIYFNNTDVFPTVNYYVQQLCGNNSGSRYVYGDMTVKATVEGRNGNTMEVSNEAASLRVRSSVVTDEKSGDMIIKLVNITPFDTPVDLKFETKDYQSQAETSVISGKPSDTDIKPVLSHLSVTENTTYTAPAYSFSVIRLKKK